MVLTGRVQGTKTRRVEPLRRSSSIADERQLMEVALAIQALIIYALLQKYVLPK
jgi:hypothetical protein